MKIDATLAVIIYKDRILGERAENIEKTIEYYNKALEVRTQKDFPMDWAATLNNLANAYKNRILGDRAENIEQIIEHCNQALKVYTYQNFPVLWALVKNNLGNAYWSFTTDCRIHWNDRLAVPLSVTGRSMICSISQEPSRQKISIVLPSTVTSTLPFCTVKACPVFQCFSPPVIIFTTRFGITDIFRSK